MNEYRLPPPAADADLFYKVITIIGTGTIVEFGFRRINHV
jgi:hypothetical protein